MRMRWLIAFCFVLVTVFSLGECSKIKVGKPHRDPLVQNEKEGKKIANKKPKTDAKISDYGEEEKEKLSKGNKENNHKMNQYETGPSPAFPEAPTTSDVTAHESEVNGCRDHPSGNCSKCTKACYGPEHETYLYSYCRRSCGFCNEKTSTFHNFWRLRANASFQPTWMLQDAEFYHEVGSSFNLASNASHAFASSEYQGFKASYAFDGNSDTAWYPANYGTTHEKNDDWIAYEFPIAVRIHGVRIHNDEKFPFAAPQTVLVEASDDKYQGYDMKWVIHNSANGTNADQSYQVHECPVLWKKHYDSDYTAWCYRLFAQAKTFDEANTICEEEGGHLASVLSNDQRNFIVKDVKICVNAWIGLKKENKAYYWIDGSDSSYHNWKEDHYTESQRENNECVMINEDGYWELERCEDKKYFVCKQKLYIRPPSKPEEVPNPLPYEPEIPPLIFYAPDVTEPVANTKHIPQGVFPDKDGKFPDGSDSSSSDSKSLAAPILYKQSLKHLDEIKGQKPQTGTKPEPWEDPTQFAIKIDALAKKLGNDMNTNNSQIKPSNNLNVPKLPTLLKLEKPQLDLTHIPGVPQWNNTDDNEEDKQVSVNPPKPSANNAPVTSANNNNKTATSNPPNPSQPTKEQADKQQQNPPAGPQKSPASNPKPPKPQESGGNGASPSVGEAGEEETNEKDDDDEDEDQEDSNDQKKIPKKPSENDLKDVDDVNDNKEKDETVGGINDKKKTKRKAEGKKQEKKPFLKRNFKIRSSVSKGENESESGSGASENKEINDILNSMNQD